MFCIGERICYPMHGIGEIEGIEQRRVLGVNAQYYLLKFDSGRVSAMVPVETAEKIGLRRLISRKEGDKVLRYIISGVASTGASQSGNWNRGIYGIADVFIFLKHKQQEKGLSASEQKMLSLTMRLLRDELLCIGCAEEEVYGAIS